MKIGINRWTLPGHLSLRECFQASRQAGFDSIEVNIAEEGELTPESTEAEVKGLVAAAQEAGIELSSLSTGLGWKYPIGSLDDSVRAKGIALVRKSLEVAQWMGVDTILNVPGTVNADSPYDVVYARSQSALKELAAEAEARKVAIGVENVWNKFLLSPMEFARYLDEVGSPYVGAYFDAGNVLVYGYPDQWIRILGNRIKKVHVKDFKANIGNITAFCNPLQGDVPWMRVKEALAAIGYDEYVTAEVDGYRVEPMLGIKHISESLRAIFGS